MKIAFAGKGGSGKTTLSSLFVRYLAARGLPVVAIDADINQHLAEALGAEEPRPLGAHLPEIKDYLRGTNPRIGSADAMIKTTPPGHGSRLLRQGGADSFASGLFTRFDLTVLVAEPTRKGVSVYQQWRSYAAGFDVPVALVGNKIQSPQDLAFLRSHAGEEPLAWIGHEPAVRAMEQGRPFGLADLAPDTAAALSAIKSRLDAMPRDWGRYTRLAAEFHLRNARTWANDCAGEDLAAQIDPDFTLGPHLLAAVG